MEEIIEVRYTESMYVPHLIGETRYLRGNSLYLDVACKRHVGSEWRATAQEGVYVNRHSSVVCDINFLCTCLDRPIYACRKGCVKGDSEPLKEILADSGVQGLLEPTKDAQAFKADDGKPNWFLLMSAQGCAAALAGVVRVLSFAVRSKESGGKGYTPHSWRQVPQAKERYEAALYRHLNALHSGETHDPESGESHWSHISCNALFLAELHKDTNNV